MHSAAWREICRYAAELEELNAAAGRSYAATSRRVVGSRTRSGSPTDVGSSPGGGVAGWATAGGPALRAAFVAALASGGSAAQLRPACDIRSDEDGRPK